MEVSLTEAGTERTSSRVAAPVEVFLESVTGHRWSEKVLMDETVGDLKRLIWRTTMLPPNRQTLVYAGRVLGDEGARLGAGGAGLRPGANIRLVLMARTGPSNERTLMSPLSAAPSSDVEYSEPRVRTRASSFASGADRLPPGARAPRLLSTRISAPEDTSAKESSAGETAEEPEEEGRDTRIQEGAQLLAMRPNYLPPQPRKQRTNSITSTTHPTVSSLVNTVATNMLGESGGGEHSASEDISEMSSGMIVCELSNEFRKLKVKRRHHNSTPAASSSRLRARSKPRGSAVAAAVSREATSSDEERRNEDDVTSATPSSSGSPSVSAAGLPSGAAACAARRATAAVRQPRQIGVRAHALRCAICAFKLTNSFNCRCGKSLCTRHRGAHGCTKVRSGPPKMLTQVSD